MGKVAQEVNFFENLNVTLFEEDVIDSWAGFSILGWKTFNFPSEL